MRLSWAYKQKVPPNSLESKSTLYSQLDPCTDSCCICWSQQDRHNSGGQSRLCSKYVKVCKWLIWGGTPLLQAWTGQRSLRGCYPVQKVLHWGPFRSGTYGRDQNWGNLVLCFTTAPVWRLYSTPESYIINSRFSTCFITQKHLPPPSPSPDVSTNLLASLCLFFLWNLLMGVFAHPSNVWVTPTLLLLLLFAS